MVKRVLVMVAVCALASTACGDDGSTGSDGSGGAGATDSTTDAGGGDTDTGGDADAAPQADDGGSAGDATDLAEDLVEDLEDRQAAEGGGSATLVVGDQEWSFDSVLCAFGEEQIGQEGAEFVLSAIQDGLQLYASIDDFGEIVSIDDIEDFENPSVSLSTFGDDATISVDGKQIRAEGGFLDSDSTTLDTVPGTLTATCP